MTIINCSLSCIYQQDGKCTFENLTVTLLSTDLNCVYFREKEPGIKSEQSTKGN